MSCDDKSRGSCTPQSPMHISDQSQHASTPVDQGDTDFTNFYKLTGLFPMWRPAEPPPVASTKVRALKCKPYSTEPLGMGGHGLLARGSKRQIHLKYRCTVGIVNEQGCFLRRKKEDAMFEITLGPKGWFELDLRGWNFKLPRGCPSHKFRIEALNEAKTVKYVSEWFVVNGRGKPDKTPPPSSTQVLPALTPTLRIEDAISIALPGHSKVAEWPMNLGGVETLGHLRSMDPKSFNELLSLQNLPLLKSALKSLRKSPTAGQSNMEAPVPACEEIRSPAMRRLGFDEVEQENEDCHVFRYHTRSNQLLSSASPSDFLCLD